MLAAVAATFGRDADATTAAAAAAILDCPSVHLAALPLAHCAEPPTEAAAN